VTAAPITALTELAEAAYARSDPASYREKWPAVMLGSITNPDRSQLMPLAVADCWGKLNRAVEVLSEVPDLSIFQPLGGQFDPALVYPGGSTRQPFSQFVASLLVSAAQRFYFLRQESTPASFVREVIENYDDLLHQGRGEPIRAYDLVGYTGIELAPNSQVTTPWGVLKAAPSNFRVGIGFNATTAILAAPCTMTLTVSRDEFPAQLPTGEPVTPNIEGTRRLLPMAFALASSQNPPCAPMVTFEAALLPLLAVDSYRYPGILFPTQQSVKPSAQELAETQAWARRLEESRSGSLQIAERRLVSAIAQRSEKVDALIDAVVAWESLVGATPNTTARVTGALANLLEGEPASRSALRKRLKEIYEIRSRVVHGDLADSDDVPAASSQAIEIGLQALRVLHDRSGDWLTMKSSTRADRLNSDE
jgi:Apea-like HEPN